MNARSIYYKISELHSKIDDLNLDFIFVTESWLSDVVTDAMLVPARKFHVVRHDRNKSGGGVCAFVNKKFNIAPIANTGGVEITAFDVIFANNKYRFIVCYRPPYYNADAMNYLTAFIDCLNSLCGVNYNVFIVGDFNLPHISWSDLSCLPVHVNFSDQFLQFICDQGLTQCVLAPTRETNVLDLVFTADPLLVSDCTVCPPLIDCDHMSVRFNVMLPAAAAPEVASSVDDHKTLVYYNFAAGDYEGLNNYLSVIDWHEVFPVNSDNINECWNKFSSVINQAIELFVPVKVFNPCVNIHERKLLPLYIRQLYRRKNAIWRLYRRHKTDAIRIKYKAACDKCKDAYRKFIFNKENDLINGGNLGSFYRYVNSKLVFKSGVGVLKDENGVFIYDDKTKAKLLNEFYSSVFANDNNVLPTFSSRVSSDCNLCDITFSADIVFRHLLTLKPKTGIGPDGLSAIFLKNVAGSIALPLSFLYSKSFEVSSLPDIWKVAIVTPVFKKGAPSSTCNYRPISITCIICKIMESIIKDNIIVYFAIVKNPHLIFGK